MARTPRKQPASAAQSVLLPALTLLVFVGCSGEAANPDDSSALGMPTFGSPSASSTGPGASMGSGDFPAASVPSTTQPPPFGAGGGGGEPLPTGLPGGGGAGGGSIDGQAGAAGGEGTGAELLDDGLPGRSLVRRLSTFEYGTTVRSLLGDETNYMANFPEDTIVNGFTNNTDVQDVGPALAEQYVITAEAVSAQAVQDMPALLGCELSEGDSCVTGFIERFGKRAWRRPLTTTEQSELFTLFQSEEDPAVGVQLLLQALLTSPSFLYRVEVGVPVAGEPYSALTSWEIATRLSYFLTGTMPDDELFAAAESDRLTTAEGVEAEARRLLELPAARSNVAEFFTGWLNLFAVERLQRDTEQFPNWDSQLPPLFYEETRTFATNVIFDGAGDLETLLTAPFTYGDPALAEYYGGTAGPVEDGVARIDLPPLQRAGILTHASFLATHAKEIQTAPVARGKFVRERMLCQGIPAPPPDLVFTAPTIEPGSTTREWFAQHEEDPYCATCHILIDPIGLAFEHYDAIGQWRDQEMGSDIDASGDLTSTDVSGPIDGIVEMSAKLAQSELATECFVRYWFRFAFGRGEGDEEAARIATITREFNAADKRVQDLLVALTLTPDFRYLAQDPTP